MGLRELFFEPSKDPVAVYRRALFAAVKRPAPKGCRKRCRRR